MKNLLAGFLFVSIFISCSEKETSPDPNADWNTKLLKSLCVEPVDTTVFNPGTGEKTLYEFARLDSSDSNSTCVKVAGFSVTIQNFKETGDAAGFFKEETESYTQGEPIKTPTYMCLMGHSVICLIGSCATKEYMDTTFDELLKALLPTNKKLPAGNTMKNDCGGGAKVF